LIFILTPQNSYQAALRFKMEKTVSAVQCSEFVDYLHPDKVTFEPSLGLEFCKPFQF
jgi:hypothetical protein